MYHFIIIKKKKTHMETISGFVIENIKQQK